MERYNMIQGSDTDFTLVHGLEAADFESTLMQEFAAYDTANAKVLDIPTFKAALHNSSLALSVQEVQALMAAIEVDADGRVVYESIAGYAYYVLQYLAEEAALQR